MSPRVKYALVDGHRVTPGTEGCRCGPACEFPCWQRVGLTDRACCPGCQPLDDEQQGTEEDE
jgi:hypothetical protein